MPYGTENITGSMYSSIGSVNSVSPSFLSTIIFCIAIVMFLTLLLNSISLKWMMKFVNFLKKTFGYALYGIFTVLIGTIIYAFIKWQVEAVGEGDTFLWKIIGYSIVSYFGLTLIGYIIKKFVIDKVKKNWKKAKKNVTI